MEDPPSPSGNVKRKTIYFEELSRKSRKVDEDNKENKDNKENRGPSRESDDKSPAVVNVIQDWKASVSQTTPTATAEATSQQTHVVHRHCISSEEAELPPITHHHPLTPHQSFNRRAAFRLISKDDSFVNTRPTTRRLSHHRRMSDRSAGSCDDLDEENVASTSTSSTSSSPSIPVAARKIIRRETSKMYKSQKSEFLRKGDTLFESVCVIRLIPIADATATQRMSAKIPEEGPTDIQWVPAVAEVFPRLIKDAAHLRTLAVLAMPDFAHYHTVAEGASNESWTFMLILTDEDGRRSFGHCRRFLHRDSGRPLVICIISPANLSTLYNGLLNEFHIFVDANGYECPQFEQLFLETISLKMPKELNNDGCVFCVSPQYGSVVDIGRRLGVETLTMLVQCLLTDTRVIISGATVPLVSATIHLLTTLMWPFTYPHALIPLLPTTFIELCHAPTPYLFGLLRSDLNQVKDMLRIGALKMPWRNLDLEEDVVIVDVDYGVLKGGVSLQRRTSSQCERLRRALKQTLFGQSKERADHLIVKLFAVHHLIHLAHFANHINLDAHKSSPSNAFDDVFNETSFIRAHPSKSARNTLQSWTNSSVWHVWLDEQVESRRADSKSMAVRTFDRYCARVKARRFGNRLPVNLTKLASDTFNVTHLG